MIAELSDTAMAAVPELISADSEDAADAADDIAGETDAQPWCVTRAEYHRLHDLGFFSGRRVERILGSIVTMSPVGWKHSLCVETVADVMRQVFGGGYFVREEKPLPVEEHSDPQPDVAVYPGGRRNYDDHPRNAVVIVEVAHTTLRHDTGMKARLYAASGLADYWVVDLERRRLMVFREPKADASSESGFSYFSLTKHAEDGVVSPLAKPDVSIKVADLLP